MSRRENSSSKNAQYGDNVKNKKQQYECLGKQTGNGSDNQTTGNTNKTEHMSSNSMQNLNENGRSAYFSQNDADNTNISKHTSSNSIQNVEKGDNVPSQTDSMKTTTEICRMDNKSPLTTRISQTCNNQNENSGNYMNEFSNSMEHYYNNKSGTQSAQKDQLANSEQNVRKHRPCENKLGTELQNNDGRHFQNQFNEKRTDAALTKDELSNRQEKGDLLSNYQDARHLNSTSTHNSNARKPVHTPQTTYDYQEDARHLNYKSTHNSTARKPVNTLQTTYDHQEVSAARHLNSESTDNSNARKPVNTHQTTYDRQEVSAVRHLNSESTDNFNARKSVNTHQTTYDRQEDARHLNSRSTHNSNARRPVNTFQTTYDHQEVSAARHLNSKSTDNSNARKPVNTHQTTYDRQEVSTSEEIRGKHKEMNKEQYIESQNSKEVSRESSSQENSVSKEMDKSYETYVADIFLELLILESELEDYDGMDESQYFLECLQNYQDKISKLDEHINHKTNKFKNYVVKYIIRLRNQFIEKKIEAERIKKRKMDSIAKKIIQVTSSNLSYFASNLQEYFEYFKNKLQNIQFEGNTIAKEEKSNLIKHIQKEQNINKLRRIENTILELENIISLRNEIDLSKFGELLTQNLQSTEVIDSNGDPTVEQKKNIVLQQIENLKIKFNNKVQIRNKIENFQRAIIKLENELTSFNGAENSYYFIDSLERNLINLKKFQVDTETLESKKAELTEKIESLQKIVNEKIEEAIRIEQSLGQSKEYEEKCIKKAEDIKANVEKISKELEIWDGKDNPYFFEESFMRSIEKVDKIEPEGNINIKETIKECIKYIKKQQDIFDRKNQRKQDIDNSKMEKPIEKCDEAMEVE